MRPSPALIPMSRLAFAVSLTAGLTAAASAQRFQRYVGTFLEERPYNVERTQDDGFLITGQRNFGSAAPDITAFITRTNNNGIVQWTSNFKDVLGVPADLTGLAVRNVSDNGAVMTARRNAGALSLGVFRTDPLGNPLWSQAYTATPVDGRCAIRETSDVPLGFAVATQRIITTAVPPTTGVFLRLDPAGGLLSFRQYSNITFTPRPGSIWLSDLRPVSGGANGFVVCGGVELVSQPQPGGPFAIQNAMLVMRLDPNGNVILANALLIPPTAGGGDQGATGLDISANGDVLIVGYNRTAAGAGEQTQVVRLNAGFGLVWARQFGGLNLAGGFTSKNIREFPSGNILVGCNADVSVPPLANGNGVMLRLNAAGGFLSAVAYGPQTNVAFQPATNAVICGPNLDSSALVQWKQTPPATPSGLGQNDALLSRTDALGRTGCQEVSIQPSIASITPLNQQLAIGANTVGDFTNLPPLFDPRPFGQTSVCCPGDITGDNSVNFSDLSAVLAGFGTVYNFTTLSAVLATFGSVCPP